MMKNKDEDTAGTVVPCRGKTHSLGIRRVQDAQHQLNEKAIKIQTSSQEALVK